MSRTIATIFTVLLLATSVLAQEIMVDPFGVSPARVKRDTVGNPQYVGIFDREFTGSTNVGVETKVYVRAVFVDSFFTNVSWELISKPAESSAFIWNSDPAKYEDENGDDIAMFVADLEGTYTVAASEGMYADTIVFDAGLYKGVGDPATSFTCAQCHNSTYTEWAATGHATFLDEGLRGNNGSYYNAGCIPCHTVGYDTDAANDGFDDFEFTFPGEFSEAILDSMYDTYPDAMARANIQCESCHGPNGGHNDGTKSVAFEMAVDQCAKCHDDDHYHVYPSQWSVSRHGNPETLARGTRAGCSDCHSGSGFVALMEADGGEYELPEVAPITCAACHDPHNATNEYQLRTVSATLSNGEEVVGAGLGALCINCHKSRRDGAQYVLDETEGGGHFGPHYGTQADLLIGTNIATWGFDVPSSPHLSATEDACVDCHMYEETAAHKQAPVSAGMHSFSMTDTSGNDNVAACADCHGHFGSDFGDKKYYINGSADHDGNGVEEGLQHEVHGLLDTLATLLPQDDEGHVSIEDTVEIPYDIRNAGYIYFSVEEDRSMGVHNPQFTVGILQLAIDILRGVVVDVADDMDMVPSSYDLGQNFPNPFNPSTTIKYSIKETGKVNMTVYDMMGREVAVLVNKTMAAGQYEVNFNASNLASGVYFYRIIAGNGQFNQVKKMLLMK